MSIPNFDDVRPYTDAEIPSAIERIANSEHFATVLQYLFPNCSVDEAIKQFRQITTIHDFQFGFMRKAMKELIDKSIDDLSSQGIENICRDRSYLFLSNHRDIVLDSALLLYLLSFEGFETAEITFGSNLMTSQLLIDIGKANKMFKFQRISGSTREILSISQQNSDYIRFALTQKHQSIWIAQRNGRTKDGYDKTDVGVLKMLAMSGNSDFVQCLATLNIVPISISYEFEPCAFLKTREVYISRRQKYVKRTNEDLESILHGIVQKKGRIHISVCKPIGLTELNKIAVLPKNERFKQLATSIDRQIYSAYKLWPNNFIAYDLLNGTDKFATNYSLQQKEQFIEYAKEGLASLEGEYVELQNIFYGIYANPVVNFENL